MQSAAGAFAPFEEALAEAHAAPIVVETFHHYYDQLVSGHTGLIAERDIQPVPSLPDADALSVDLESRGFDAQAHLAVIKLNGGLGTSMGLDRAKSLLEVKQGLSFLDVIVRQVLARRKASGAAVPLLLMDSFATDDDTVEALRAYPEVELDHLPLTFLQNKIPKVLVDGFGLPDPRWGELAWCPPGHGDLYTALYGSGLLDRLLARGITHAFVSNADNLGATIDFRILGYIVAHQLPFLMEVADRTEADKKGGHLARHRDGRLLLREVAQCPPDDLAAFQDVNRHRYFNTNNIWLDLRAVRRLLDESGGIFRLPLIRNRKTIDPRDPRSPAVYQLETAMGAAVELFFGAAALRVPRTRFAPVKLSSDLLTLWSDAYTLTFDYHLHPVRPTPPVVLLHDPCYRLVDDMKARFPHGAPSLHDCDLLDVRGDVTFGRGVVVRGTVHLAAPSPATLDDGRVLEGDVTI